MFRRTALYIWLALIAVALAYIFIDVNVNGVELPHLPMWLIITFLIVAGLLTALVFYQLFHGTPEGRRQLDEEIERYERRKRAAQESPKSKWH